MNIESLRESYHLLDEASHLPPPSGVEPHRRSWVWSPLSIHPPGRDATSHQRRSLRTRYKTGARNGTCHIRYRPAHIEEAINAQDNGDAARWHTDRVEYDHQQGDGAARHTCRTNGYE